MYGQDRKEHKRGGRGVWKIGDLPDFYQAQVRAQLDALAARCAPAQPQQDAGVSLESQARYPALLAHPAGSLSVRIIRIGGRALDDDNLAAGCKELRDAVAAALGRHGDSERDGLAWEYVQEPGEIGTRIEITEG